MYIYIHMQTIGILNIEDRGVSPRHRHRLTQSAPMSGTQNVFVIYVQLLQKPCWNAESLISVLTKAQQLKTPE